ATEDAAPVTGTVAGNDSDADGDTLSYTLDAAVAGLTFNADGSYSFDPSDAAYQDLAVGETRDVVASYTVSDGDGGTATSTLTITVTGTNDAPAAVADSYTVDEDNTLTIAAAAGVLANDSDPDG
ncbi:Ig-like domain-containing protein, partial [Altererythrobacter sp. C41]|uniref:Ig-like domain-containing protein n=1 Tax=Altererythrobacter sp. C41 TaxID=2806021 RepID=UPI0019338204